TVRVLDNTSPHRPITLPMHSLYLLLVTSIIHYINHFRAGLELRAQHLAAINDDLAKREEEIARQNEELQSQTEELERQSEELRVTNDELASRERTLEQLLSLSRSLSGNTQRSEIMAAVCETMGYLMNGKASA